MKGLAARNGGRWGLAALVVILLLGVALRVDYAAEGREPVFDAAAYGQIAIHLADGQGFTLGHGATQPASNYSPGLPLFAAGLYELSGGENERFVRVVLALIGCLAVLFTYLIGRRLAGPGAGLLGAAAVAIYPSLLEYQGMLMGEPFATTLLSGAVLAILWARGPVPAVARAGGAGTGVLAHSPREDEDPPPRDRTRAPRWLIPGLLLGALALLRPEYLGVAALLAVVVAIRGPRGHLRVAVGAAGLLLVGVALVVAPWTIRNAVELGRFVPVSTGGGQVLFAGSYLPSDGDPERVGREVLERHPGLTQMLAGAPVSGEGRSSRASGAFLTYTGRKAPGEAALEIVLDRYRLEQILAALAEQRYPGMETDRALAGMGRERLWADLGERPLDYAGFVAAKMWNLWGHGPREVMERPGWELFHWALLLLAVAGAVALARQGRWEVVPILVVIVAITAISAVLVASPRRVLVMLPLVAALAGAGATAGRDSLARRWRH